jgi:GDP-L-fucose synthase
VMYHNSKKPLKENQIKTDKIFNKYFGAAWMKLFVEKKCEFYAKFRKNKYTIIRHSNIYGPHDKFDLEKSHVFGATITKVLKKKKNFIEVWGDGSEKRNFLYIDDLTSFILLSIKNQKDYFKLYNLGSDKSISIKHLVKSIIKCSGNDIKIKFLKSGPTLKTNILIDSSKAKKELGWKQKFGLEKGIKLTMKWYKENVK